MTDKQEIEAPKRVTKIKVKKGAYYFAWEVFQANTENWDQHTLSCRDVPRPELLKRLQVMANHVTEICEFSEWEKKKLIVSGVSLSYGDKGNCYLVITAQKVLEFSKAPLIINTPARPAMPENDTDSQEFCWSKPKNTSGIVVSEWHVIISIGRHSNQRWNFEECENGRIRLQYKNIGVFMPRRRFEADWEIIKAEG